MKLTPSSLSGGLPWVSETPGRSLHTYCDGHGTASPNLELSKATKSNSITAAAPPENIQSQFDFYSSSWHKDTLEAIIWTFQYWIYRNLKMLCGLD